MRLSCRYIDNLAAVVAASQRFCLAKHPQAGERPASRRSPGRTRRGSRRAGTRCSSRRSPIPRTADAVIPISAHLAGAR